VLGVVLVGRSPHHDGRALGRFAYTLGDRQCRGNRVLSPGPLEARAGNVACAGLDHSMILWVAATYTAESVVGLDGSQRPHPARAGGGSWRARRIGVSDVLALTRRAGLVVGRVRR